MSDTPETSSLAAALAAYDRAIAAIATQDQPSETAALAVLVHRDTIQHLLAEPGGVSAAQLVQLRESDRQLRQQRPKLVQAIAEPETWRQLQPTPPSGWWWDCLQPRSFWTQFDWVWNASTVVFLTASLSLLTATSSRFLAADSGLVGSFAIVGQAVLTLLGGGGTLTGAGRELVASTYRRLRIPTHSRQEASALLAFLVMVLLIGAHASLPRFARYFNQRGYKHYQNDAQESAIADYQTAIALRPDYAQARYRLAVVYEDLQQYEAAQEQYRLAVATDATMLNRVTQLEARNNLGRLYILTEDYQAALAPLREGLNQLDAAEVEADPELAEVQYALTKNLGWAQLELGNYVTAASLLQQAIALAPKNAPAYCLQGKLAAAQERTQAELEAWQACIQYADISQPDEYLWWSTANQALAAADAPE